MFKIGDKVVCVNDKNQEASTGDKLIKGKEYVVSEIHEFFDAVYLHGINNHYGGYWSRRFIKVDESFADSVLEKITEQIKEEELELV